MVRDAYPDEFLPQTFASTDVFLQLLARLAQRHPGEPVIAIVDELPYLAEAEPGFLTALQHWWDGHKALPNLKLFLAGSYLAFMERQVLHANAPLYNRRTGQMRLAPMAYFEAALFFPHYSPRQKLETYAILGGMPLYLEQFSPDKSWDANLLSTALRPNTYLTEEPEWLLLQDLRTEVIYGSILRAIAAGNRKPSDIARAIGKQSAQDIAPHLQSLLELNLIRRDMPITDRNRPGARKSLYWLADNYLAFWYRYVDPARSLIVHGQEDQVLARIKRSLHEYIARPPFEEVCRQFLWHALASGRLPTGLTFEEVGTWWDGPHEIDVVAQEGSTTTLVGSCKWTAAPMSFRDLNRLQQSLASGAGALKPADGCWHALFSREGFEPRLSVFAAQSENRVLLFTPDDLFAF